jgi:8-oxo-dGTP pyrophosphatase MutT (NUDIX family)
LSGTTPLRQVAALPFVDTGSGVLVLLITTRGMGRWTIPKGWPKPGLSDAEMAAREAFEEAGVAGEISPRPIANFLYTKRLHLFSWARCSVDVYALHTRCQELSWPEKESRKSMWVEPVKAASIVKESQLAKVLHEFGASRGARQAGNPQG